jgi:uncharacterized coiled-coil protein SlyX
MEPPTNEQAHQRSILEFLSNKIAEADKPISGERQPERVKRLASLFGEIKDTALRQWGGLKKRQDQRNAIREDAEPYNPSPFQICIGGIVAELREDASDNITDNVNITITELEAMLDRMRDAVKTAVNTMRPTDDALVRIP